MLFLLFFGTNAGMLHAAFEHVPADARSAAMGGATIAVPGGPFSLFYNPALMTLTSGRTLGLSYDLPYGDPDMQSSAAGIVFSRLPFDQSGALGIGMKRYGSDRYHETSGIAAYARNLEGKINAGVSIAWKSREIQSFGSDSVIGINLGLTAELLPGLVFGFSTLNVNTPSIGKDKEALPQSTFFGASYRLTSDILLAATVEADPDYPLRLLTGSEIQVLRHLSLRAGVATNPSVFSGGAAFGTEKVKANIAVAQHSELGTSTFYTVEVAF
jgi:hypothetical protein